MKHPVRLIIFALIIAAAGLLPATAPALGAGVIYVDASSSCAAGCGGSWANAYPKLQDALAAAANGDQIWVAKGVYYPDEGAGQTDNARASTFILQNGVAIYGGFAGTETALSQRDVAANVTVLSGDIDGNDVTDANGVVTNTTNINGNNAYHVVTSSSANSTAVLDGFTVTAGQANGPSGGEDNGGGMYNKNSSSPTVSNVTFSANSATRGGGMNNDTSSPALTNVTFSANSAVFGGGMKNTNGSPSLTNVTFSANSASANGGGIYNYNSAPTMTNVTFSSNSAATNGGGLYNYDSDPTLSNVTFSGNSAGHNGGGLYNNSSSPTVTNVTFSGNSTGQNGGGLYNYYSDPTLTNATFSGNSADKGGGLHNYNSSPALTNVTFSSNSATNNGGGGMYSNSFDSSDPVLTNTIIANSASGGDCVGPVNPASSHNIIRDSAHACGLTNGSNGNIIGSDPSLGALTDFGGPGKQVFPLLSSSPAKNAGTNAGCPTTDQRGAPRPSGGVCDIGAYERDGLTWDGGGTDNNWSTALNWTGDMVPGPDNDVYFNSTSTKDSVIDAGFGGAVANIDISAGYTGVITFGRSLAVSGDYSQDGGTVVADPAHAFTVDGAFSHTGGALQETRPVGPVGNVNFPVDFLHIQDSGNTTDKHRCVTLDTTATGNDLGSVTVSIRAVDTSAGEYCTSAGAGSPPYAGRCFSITPTNNLPARVTLWALSSETPAAITSPSVYRYHASAWQELTGVATGASGDYTWAAGDAPGFSAFLMAQAGSGGNAPTAVSLQSFAATGGQQGFHILLAAAALLLLVASSKWLAVRSGQ